MQKEMQHLKALRNSISEDSFRYLAAEIATKHFIYLMKLKGKKLDRQTLLDRTNLMLKAMGMEEVSYGFIRKLY